MALNLRDLNTLAAHLGKATNLNYIVGSLSVSCGRLMLAKPGTEATPWITWQPGLQP